ncbi:uncharacterized protein V6R79_015667 [Siganus canaliculatus]
MMLQGESIRQSIPVDHSSDHSARCAEREDQRPRWESEWHLEAERHKAEAKRLKRQVEELKDTAERDREEIRGRDSTMKRQSCELQAVHEELHKAKTDLMQIREELIHNSAQKENINSQLEKLKSESTEEILKLRRDIERCKEEAQELALKAEMSRLHAEEVAKQQTHRISEQLEEMHNKHNTELQTLNASHCADLGAARKTNRELQDRLQSMTSEVLQLKNSLVEVSAERDGLKEHLSQMGQAFETQSATLQSLRNYIGQLAPEKGEKERLNDTIEKLKNEKAALQMTTELLTVRLHSANEILTLQEEKIVRKAATDPLVKNGSEGLQVLQLWREKVFKLCVQLRSKDIELGRDKDKLLSKVRSTEQQLQQEQLQACVLQHSLDDKIAELDLERVEKETLKHDLIEAHKENSQIKSQNQKAQAELKSITEAVHRFSLTFKNKVAEVDAAQTRLNTLMQRLNFARGRVETVQGLLMRKVALQKVIQASKQEEHVADSLTNLQTELRLVCEERDKLTQELKRTPELIEKTVADMKGQYEIKLRQQQTELEQSWAEVRKAVAGKEEADQSLQQIQAQLEESKVSLEKCHSELLSQQECSERVLQERLSEITDRCAEKLREMEAQVNSARREHTKAVMTLRQFERESARKQHDKMRETGHLGSEHMKRKVQNKQATVEEGELAREDTRAPTAALQSSAAPREKHSERSRYVGAKVHLPSEERLLSVLEELHSLSAAVVNSSEGSAEEEEEEEEGQNDSVGPSRAVHTADT